MTGHDRENGRLRDYLVQFPSWTEEKTKAQRGAEAGTRAHSKSMAELMAGTSASLV